MISAVTPLHLLIIEDEPRLRDLLVDATRGWGFKPLVARSGEEGLRLADQSSVDVVLLDLNLPGRTGLETLAEIRRRDIDAPAIVMTGFGDLKAAQQAIELGVVAFLTKPTPLGELEAALDRARKQIKAELPTRQTTAVDPLDPAAMKLDEVERQHILTALQKNAGNRTATARELGISRRTLQYRLAAYHAAGWVEGDA